MASSPLSIIIIDDNNDDDEKWWRHVDDLVSHFVYLLLTLKLNEKKMEEFQSTSEISKLYNIHKFRFKRLCVCGFLLHKEINKFLEQFWQSQPIYSHTNIKLLSFPSNFFLNTSIYKWCFPFFSSSLFILFTYLQIHPNVLYVECEKINRWKFSSIRFELGFFLSFIFDHDWYICLDCWKNYWSVTKSYWSLLFNWFVDCFFLFVKN